VRAYSVLFNEKNSGLNKHPRWVLEIAFDTANTDLYYITSHADCEVPPGTASANIIYGALKKPVVTSQKLDTRTTKFSIGTLTADIIDINSAFSTLIGAKQAAGYGLRHKRVRIYRGYAGLPWADYQLPPGGTQIIDGKLSSHKGTFTLRGNDIQRSTKKDIFDVKKTNLTADYTAGDSTVTVVDTSAFEMVAHGTSFTDAPSATVGYFQLGDNVIRYTGKTATTFTGCVGGRFSTKDVDVAIDSGATNDRQPEIKEFIYLEMPAAKMAKAILMGTNPTLPAHWQMGISSTYVATSQFDGIGTDLYDTTDDTAGFVLRFIGLKKRDGKTFLQKQVNLPQGCFMPVLADGQLGYKRMTGVLSGASPVAVLDASNIKSYSRLDHDQAALSNQYEIAWNRVVGKDKPTRLNVYEDTTSIATHQAANPYELTFEGLSGSRHTDAVIHGTFDVLRDRYSGPPLLITVEAFDSQNGIEIGDVVWCNFNQRDFVGGGDLNRAFEVVGYRATGKTVTLTLFGSSQKAGALSASTASTVMANSFYSSGLTAGNKLDVATTGSLTGSVWHITGDSTLTGGTDMGTTADVFWYDGDVTIDSGVTLTLVNNVQLRVMGTITNNGTIDLSGNGIAGVATTETVGTAGYIGSTMSGAGFTAEYDPLYLYVDIVSRGSQITVSGDHDSAPYLSLENSSTTLAGISGDFRPTSGGAGFDVVNSKTGAVLAAGGAGGAGAASAVVICRGWAAGASGVVNLNGEKGGSGGSFTLDPLFGTRVVYAGAGAGGAPGVFYVLLDGNTSAIPSVSEFTATTPTPDLLGHPSYQDGRIFLTDTQQGWPVYNRHSGLHGFDLANSRLQVQYIPPSETAAEDVEELTDPPTAITIQEATATNNSMNLVALEISVTAPAATNYRGSMIYIKKNGTNSWQQVGEARATEEVIFYVPADGTTYNVKAHPVSILGVESPEFYGPTNHTVATTQVAVIGTNNTLATGADVATNGGMRIDTNGLDSFDTGGQQTVDIDQSDGSAIFGVVADEKYLKFNGTTGVLALGRDTVIRGSDAYNNDNIYFHDFFYSIDAWSATVSSSNAIVDLQTGGYMRVLVQGSAVESALVERLLAYPLVIPTWAKVRRFKVALQTGVDSTSGTGRVVSGNLSTGFIGFKISGTAIRGICAQAGTEQNVLLTATLSGTRKICEAVFTPGVSVKFYIDGVFDDEITSTSDLPTSTSGANKISIKVEKTAANSNNSAIRIGEIKVLQED